MLVIHGWIVVFFVLLFLTAQILMVSFQLAWMKHIRAEMAILEKRIKRFRMAPGDELLNPPRQSSGIKMHKRGGQNAEPGEALGVPGQTDTFYHGSGLFER